MVEGKTVLNVKVAYFESTSKEPFVDIHTSLYSCFLVAYIYANRADRFKKRELITRLSRKGRCLILELKN